MTPEQEIRAKALAIYTELIKADVYRNDLDSQAIVDGAEVYAGWIATGELDKPWTGQRSS
jgi:hypothetical protein